MALPPPGGRPDLLVPGSFTTLKTFANGEAVFPQTREIEMELKLTLNPDRYTRPTFAR